MNTEDENMGNAPKPGEPDRRPLPDPEICRAQMVIHNVGECLVKSPYRCGYATSFGDGFICQNPDVQTIVERTRAARKKAQAG